MGNSLSTLFLGEEGEEKSKQKQMIPQNLSSTIDKKSTDSDDDERTPERIRSRQQAFIQK